MHQPTIPTKQPVRDYIVSFQPLHPVQKASLPILKKLKQAGDQAAAAILSVILRAEMAERYRAPKLRSPFNIEARRGAWPAV
jgi:uncharacterized ferritin-like protein (DUF455 family)